MNTDRPNIDQASRDALEDPQLQLVSESGKGAAWRGLNEVELHPATHGRQ